MRRAENVFEFAAGPYRSGELAVVSFRGVEQISRPFRFDLVVSASPVDVEAELVGETAALSIHGDEGPIRVVHGMIAAIRAEAALTAQGRSAYRVRLVPRLWALGVSKNSRIFQDKGVPEIVGAVLDESRIDHQWKVSRAYPPRTYCVQYQESDLAFVARLLAEEGIFYWIDTAAGKKEGSGVDTVLFADDAAHYDPIQGSPAIPFHEAHGMARGREHVEGLSWRKQARPGATLLSGLDFRRPTLDLHARGRADAPKTEGAEARRIYEHDMDWSLWTVSPEAARVHVEQHRARASVGAGRSSSARLVPGRWFDLEEHPSADLNRRYAVVRVEHEGREPQVAGAGPSAPAEGQTFEIYSNRFECVVTGVAARPRRPKRRYRQIMETATVVGPEGEEIHTDEHGRVKVQFHWDRQGQRDDKSSCWIRSMHPWAGSAWGVQFIPRVGMEVVVTFVGGDTDRPMILGGLYNGANPPPFPLPGKKTQSGIRTRSSPGGGGANELRFEDAAAQEQIYLHAQRDLVELVENDHARQVRGHETIRVDRSRTVDVLADHVRTVHGNEVITIHKNLVLHVVGSQIIQIDGSSGGDAADGAGPIEIEGLAPGEALELEAKRSEEAALEAARRAQIEGAKLMWLAEQLPDPLYERGRLLCEAAQAAREEVLAIQRSARALALELARSRSEAPPGAPAERAGAIAPIAARIDQVKQALSEHLTAALAPAPPPFHRLQSAVIEHIQSLDREAQAALRSLEAGGGEGGSRRGGGGGDDKFTKPKPGEKGTPQTAFKWDKNDKAGVPAGQSDGKGSVMDITGGGTINSPQGFKIVCAGSSIELTPGGINIKGPVVNINADPINLNC